MNNITLTDHAIRRGQQRGFRKKDICTIIEFGKPIRKPGNVFEISISKKQFMKMDKGKIGWQHSDKLLKKAILIDQTSGTVITVYNKAA